MTRPKLVAKFYQGLIGHSRKCHFRTGKFYLAQNLTSLIKPRAKNRTHGPQHILPHNYSQKIEFEVTLFFFQRPPCFWACLCVAGDGEQRSTCVSQRRKRLCILDEIKSIEYTRMT